MTLFDVIRMLRDKDGWRFARHTSCGGTLSDEVVYRDTNIYTYLDTGAIRLRQHPHRESTIVYEAGAFGMPVVSILAWLLRRHLEAVK